MKERHNILVTFLKKYSPIIDEDYPCCNELAEDLKPWYLHTKSSGDCILAAIKVRYDAYKDRSPEERADYALTLYPARIIGNHYEMSVEGYPIVTAPLNKLVPSASLYQPGHHPRW